MSNNDFSSFNANETFGGQSDDFESGSEYFAPMIMFMKGDPSIGAAVAKASKVKLADVESIAFHGGFFITDDNVPKDGNGDPMDLTAYGWLRDSFVSSETNKDVMGYSRRAMSIAAITQRSGWRVQGKGIFPTYDEAKEHGRPSGLTHIVIVIEGMEEFGPFVLSLSGYSQMAFNGAGQFSASGFVAMAKNTVLAAAKAASPGNWLMRAFWIPIRASVNNAGEPLFYTAGKGDKTTKIVVPQFGIDNPADVDPAKMFVGGDNVTKFNEIADDAADWREEWKEAKLVKDDPKKSAEQDNPFDNSDQDLLESVGI